MDKLPVSWKALERLRAGLFNRKGLKTVSDHSISWQNFPICHFETTMESKTKNELKETQMETKDESKVEAKEDPPNETDDDVMRKSVDMQLKKTRELFEIIGEKSKAAYKIMKEDYEMVKEKEENFKEMTKKLEDVHFTDVIKLDVGGEVFKTSLKTLLQQPNSLFATQFSQCLRLKQTSNEAFFIDRDGSYFRHLMNYMRTGIVTPKMNEVKAELIEEAKYYGLPNLVKALFEKNSEDTKGNCAERAEDGGTTTLDDHSNKTREMLQDAIKVLDAGQDSLKNDLCLLEGSKENYLRMSERLKDVHFSETVHLNVGGHLFITSKSTLLNDPNSILAAMFSQRFKLEKQKDGSYFVDRDGTHFRHVLNYLRMGRLPRSVIEEVGDELLEEAEFYNIKGLSELILKRTTVELKIDDKIFLTTPHTVKRDPGFEEMLFGSDSKIIIKDGAYVIRRHVNDMDKVLMFLENGILPKDYRQIERELLLDAQALNVSTLQKRLCGFPGSKILNGKHSYVNKLLEWISTTEDQSVPLLLYSSEEPEPRANAFFNKCANIASTIIIVETGDGCIFGGYTSQMWHNTSSGIGYRDRASFIFSLKSLEWDEPVIMKASENGGITAKDDGGISFCEVTGCHTPEEDLLLFRFRDKRLKYSPKIRGSYSCENLNDNNFSYPPGVPKTETFLAGKKDFLVKIMEVFHV